MQVVYLISVSEYILFDQNLSSLFLKQFSVGDIQGRTYRAIRNVDLHKRLHINLHISIFFGGEGPPNPICHPLPQLFFYKIGYTIKSL